MLSQLAYESHGLNSTDVELSKSTRHDISFHSPPAVVKRRRTNARMSVSDSIPMYVLRVFGDAQQKKQQKKRTARTDAR